MNRRGVIGALLGAPAATQVGLAQSAGFDQAARGMSLNRAVGGIVAQGRTEDWLKSEIAGVREELANIGKDRQEQVRAARRMVARLDADIDANRSFSMATKIRLQAERDVDFQNEQQRGWVGRRLAGLLGTKP